MKILTTSLAVLVCVGSIHAQSTLQVNYQASPGMPAVHRLNGTLLPNGNAVWIGSFDNGYDVAANSDDPLDLFNHFNRFGETTIQPILGQGGRFTSTATSTDPAFSNQKIYLWIFSTTLNNAPAVDMSNVNQYGLYSSTAGWNFPSTSGGPPLPKDIFSNEINQYLWGSGNAGGLFLSPVSPVPEPSTLGLLGLAIPAALLAWRRRRS